MKKKNMLFAFITIIVLTSCFIIAIGKELIPFRENRSYENIEIGTEIDSDKISMLKKGMTVSEVESIIGPPDRPLVDLYKYLGISTSMGISNGSIAIYQLGKDKVTIIYTYDQVEVVIVN